MIDEKTLADEESEFKRLQHHYEACPDMDMKRRFAKRATIDELIAGEKK